jgi:PHD/YefM family antitoxin component YafN of YafNO toxin-antitoxin module
MKNQERKPPNGVPVYLILDEETYNRLTKVITHYGQKTHEMREAIRERVEKLERLQQEQKAS